MVCSCHKPQWTSARVPLMPSGCSPAFLEMSCAVGGYKAWYVTRSVLIWHSWGVLLCVLPFDLFPALWIDASLSYYDGVLTSTQQISGAWAQGKVEDLEVSLKGSTAHPLLLWSTHRWWPCRAWFLHLGWGISFLRCTSKILPLLFLVWCALTIFSGVLDCWQLMGTWGGCETGIVWANFLCRRHD